MSKPTPADRALRALADAVGESRPRRPEDGDDPDVPVAATVVIVRDAVAGPEVLMIERPDRGSFPGAWVFPGGKLEPADRAEADDTRVDRTESDELVAARRAGVRETAEETGLRTDAVALVPLSCWDPPPGLPLRIRTWFFLVPDPGGDMTLAADEVIAAAWVRPADMLARHGRGEITLYPPTWVTLHTLADQPDADALLGVARIGGIRRFETVARRGGEGAVLLWQGDAAYDEHAPADPAARHRLELASLPWIYTRTD
ncbi:NUDIX hydrolase [Microbacterium sp.]|uniref:NUDIX hydrolase n=1 Tax=Microbacterium sp. TaxID=51671 RepID=UPI002E351696|nr:NUDIX hydrolase [Microbacterium sp.]HEX5728986.1 NUDIX hydrolase [Microbacterium sp.]